MIQASIAHICLIFFFLMELDFQMNRKLQALFCLCMSQPYQTDLLLTACWQLLQMDISVQKGDKLPVGSETCCK